MNTTGRRPGRRRAAALLAGIFALLLGAGSATARDQLIIGTTQYPSTLNPNIEAMLAKTYLLALTMRPFTQYDANWQLACFLCTELPTLENGKANLEGLDSGKQGVAATYTIQPKATWGDGTPVTTKDVLFTYEVGKHPQSRVSNAELYRRILKIDVIDDKTFTMHFDRVEFSYNAINDFELLPEHLEREAFADPATYHTRTRFDTDPTNPGLWFGPYRVTAIEPGAQIVLDANPTWWGKPPAFKRIVLKTIENTAALEANLLSGGIDYIAGEMGLSLDQALTFEKRHADAYDIVYKPALFYEHLDVNLENPILADRRVRQALLFGLDREALNQQLFAGRQTVATTFMSPLDWVFTKDVTTYPYDPKKAAALLDEAGWTLGGDGIRAKDGKRLSLEIMTTAGDRTRELVEQVLQGQWKAIGIEVRIRNEPARVFFGETVSKRKFPDLALFAWFSSPEHVPRSTLHSQEIPSAANGWSGQNYTGFRNAESDGLIDKIEIELDKPTRGEMWHRVQQIYAEELPALPLYFRSEAFIFPKWLKGVVPTGHMGVSSLWVEDWSATE
jgi:peptide/nickel transport system substrate-binding protein